MPLSTNDHHKTTLVVCDSTFDRAVLPGENYRWLEYSFVDTYPSDGFAAWRTDSSTIPAQVDVADTCRVYSGGFSQHGLNRFFAEAVIAHRVSAVVVIGLNGCTADLPRVAALMGIPCDLVLNEPSQAPQDLDQTTAHWVRDSLAKCRSIIPEGEQTAQQWPGQWIQQSQWGSYDQLRARQDSQADSRRLQDPFEYSTYEFSQRDHPLLLTMQRGDTVHFTGCQRVLDLGCGVGIFLDCLRQQGIDGVGVERDGAIADYGRGMGLDIVNADALEFLEQSDQCFDGIYCSHFVEHLPFEQVRRLIDLLQQRLAPGGVVVLTFPDPESIRAQLLGFWRDPEHVRFYHPNLIASLAISAGLEMEWSSYDAQPHRIVSFPEQPPPLAGGDALPPIPDLSATVVPGNWLDSMMSRLGFVSRRQFDSLQSNVKDWAAGVHRSLEQQRLVNSQLGQRTDSLWDVNQTWAWNDNATLRLRKRAD